MAGFVPLPAAFLPAAGVAPAGSARAPADVRRAPGPPVFGGEWGIVSEAFCRKSENAKWDFPLKK